MKYKIIYAIAAITSALLFFDSCSKQLPEEPAERNSLLGGSLSFTASIEQELTRTFLDSGSSAGKFKVKWIEGDDRININGCEYIASAVGDDAAKATFTPVATGATGTSYSAIYPASLYVPASVNPSAGEHYELPAVQIYEAGQFNAPMYANSTSTDLVFKNVCGVLCLSLKGDANDIVKYVTVIAKNEGVCGKFTMDHDGETLSLSTTVGEYSRAVTLDCGEGVSLDPTSAKNFYVYLPPKTYSAGMKIIITTAESKVFEMETKSEATIERNNIYTFDNWKLDFKDKPALLSGVFTVASGFPPKTVRFTKGNLWTNKNWTSSNLFFETNQWESLPASDGNKLEDHVSHFVWARQLKDAAEATIYESGIFFCDYNHKLTVDGQSSCYALNNDEWSYLVNGRTNHDDKRGYATVNNVFGVVFLPDSFQDPYAGIKQFVPISYTDKSTANVYSAAEWIAMESGGAVFLPAAGYRVAGSVCFVGGGGYYWSSTWREAKYAYNMYFTKNTFSVSWNAKSNGAAIRLVVDAGSPLPSDAPIGTRIYASGIEGVYVGTFGGKKLVVATKNYGAENIHDKGTKFLRSDLASFDYPDGWQQPSYADMEALAGAMKFTDDSANDGAYNSAYDFFIPYTQNVADGNREGRMWIDGEGDYAFYWFRSDDKHGVTRGETQVPEYYLRLVMKF